MIDRIKDLAQFKLTNGSEVVCEVMEWPEKEGDDIIARNAMSIVPFELEGSYIYGFKPWLHYLESSDEYMTINPSHVVASARPNYHLELSYNLSVSDMNTNAKEREAAYQKEQEERLEKITKAIADLATDKSAKTSKTSDRKIIVFPGKNDLVH